MEKRSVTVGPINNEVDFCKVYDLATKEKVERILLANRISYCCHFEDKGFLQKLFSPVQKTVCTFRIHDEEVPRAKELVRSYLARQRKNARRVKNKERKNVWKEYDEITSAR